MDQITRHTPAAAVPSPAHALSRRNLLGIAEGGASTVWETLHAAGIDPAPRRSGPVGELRRELFDRMLITNEEHLRRTLITYLAHRKEARPHRTASSPLPRPKPARWSRPTWRTTGSAGNPYSEGSLTNTRSPSNHVANGVIEQRGDEDGLQPMWRALI